MRGWGLSVGLMVSLGAFGLQAQEAPTDEPHAVPAVPAVPAVRAAWDEDPAEAKLPSAPAPMPPPPAPPSPAPAQLRAMALEFSLPSPRCAAEEECIRAGACKYVDGDCVVASDVHCRDSKRCKSLGLCTAFKGHCVASSAADCRRSRRCRTDGKCWLFAEEGECATGTRPRNPHMKRGGLAAIIIGTTSGGVGVVLLIVGAYFGLLGALMGPAIENEQPRPLWETNPLVFAGAIMFPAGAVTAVGIGVPLFVAGRHPVPPDASATVGEPVLSVGPSGGSLTWAF